MGFIFEQYTFIFLLNICELENVCFSSAIEYFLNLRNRMHKLRHFLIKVANIHLIYMNNDQAIDVSNFS